MTNLSGRIPTLGHAAQQQDKVEGRQRVAIYVDGNSVAYEGSLTTGPDVVCNFHTDAVPQRNAHYGYLINDGPGDLQISWSYDGTNYGGVHTVKIGEQISFDGFTLNKLKLTWITDTSYRILMM